MDVDQILLGVRERDNWRRRLDVLRRSLTDVRRKRAYVAARLRRIRRELARLADLTDAVWDASRPTVRTPAHAPREANFRGR
jgi:hypothetical protein